MERGELVGDLWFQRSNGNERKMKGERLYYQGCVEIQTG